MSSGVVVLLSIPGLRAQDLSAMPQLRRWAEAGEQRTLRPGFPAVTWPVQAAMLTGERPAKHGVIANGFYWRDTQQVEMWTAWNKVIEAPQIWDRLHEKDPELTSAVWFPMLSKGCGADYICMPAPIHNPDGSESLWCYTKPVELYGQLRDELGHFPLQHFWGPLANIRSTAWIVDSAVVAATMFQPRFFYLYLPHLDYAAQKHGPDSEPARTALAELDATLVRLETGLQQAYQGERVLWVAASEYAISPVDHVTYPNRVLREAGLLRTKPAAGDQGGEEIDLGNSAAWALVDHQLAHVFVRDRDPKQIEQVVQLFRDREGVDEVLAGEQRRQYQLEHERAGDVVLISTPNSWMAYYWWLDDAQAPPYARTVDIHRKPGYDPVELHFDPATRSIPLDANLIRGSHGAPPRHEHQMGVILASQADVLPTGTLDDIDVAAVVLRQFE